MSINVGIVGMISIESVIVSDRARQDMGNLDEIEANMREVGLISPLAVRDNQDGTYTLLAGERRYTILKRNEVDQIPVRIFHQDLTDIEMKIIEKAENFYRKDFEYWELDKLTAEITEMQQSIHGKRAPGPGHTGWGLDDTAAMIGGVTKATVSTSIRRAQAREAMPELFEKCKTASDANKVLKKIDEAAVRQVIAHKLEANKSDTTLVQLSKSYIVGDFFKGIKKTPDGIFHLVEIDPPYGIDLNDVKKSDGESQYDQGSYNEVPTDRYQVFLSTLFQECYRVMADHSWLICWFAPEPWFEIIYQELCNAGFTTTRMCGIWTKPSGQTLNPDVKLANSYEMFFYAWKGRPALAKPGRTNIFDYPPVPSSKKTHPTERPVELMKDIYETFAFPGSRVLIPFLGSGSGIIAANEVGMSPVGFELSQSYKDSFLVKVHRMRQ